MKFTKSNAKFYGHKGGLSATHKKSAATLERERAASQAERERERAAFERFLNAESGFFNGFEMSNIFHAEINKFNAVQIAESNEQGDALGVHVGADGVTCYFFTNPANVKKQVVFNRSVYLF